MASPDPRSYHHRSKLMADPVIQQGGSPHKTYSSEDSYSNHALYEDSSKLKDPRTHPTKKYRSTPFHQTIKLLPTKFTIDANYCGRPPEVEVVLENLNDNVSETVLREQLQKYAGNAATVTIAYHPTTKKHLGFAHVVFVDENATGKCLKHMHGRSVMGNVVAVSKDPLRKKFKKLFSDATTEGEKAKVPAPGTRPPVAEAPKVPQLHHHDIPVASTPSSHGVPGTPFIAAQTPLSGSEGLNSSFQSPKMYSQGSSAPPPHRRSANEDATVNHVRSPHENHVQLAPVEPPAAPLPRPSLEERVQLFRKQFKSGKGPLDKVLFEFIDSDDEEEEKEREKAAAEVKQEMVDGNTAGMSPNAAFLMGRRNRWDPIPRAALPPPGVVILGNPTRPGHAPYPASVVDPKSNLLSNLFLHTGLYNVQSQPEDLRAFYQSFFRPWINPHHVHHDCRQVLKGDLRSVMSRDIKKRVVDAVVFKTVDNWFERNQREMNEKMSIRNVPSTINPHVIDITNTVDQILRGETNFTTHSRGFAGGFGLRSAIPKMPSFRRQVPLPVPSMDQENEPDANERASSSIVDVKRETSVSKDSPSKKRSKSSKEKRKKQKKRHDESISEEENETPSVNLASASLMPDAKIKVEENHDLEKRSILEEYPQRSVPAVASKVKDTAEPSLVRIKVEPLATSETAAKDFEVLPTPQVAHSRKPATPPPPEVTARSDLEPPEPVNPLYLLVEATEVLEQKEEKRMKLKEESIRKSNLIRIETELRVKPKKVPPPSPVSMERSMLKEKPVRLPPWKRMRFSARTEDEERRVMNAVVEKGLDQEDITYLKVVSDEILSSENGPPWMNVFHWVNHPATIIPDLDSDKGPSEGGCARCTPYKRTTRRILHLRKNATVDATVASDLEQIERVSAPQKSARGGTGGNGRNVNDRSSGDLDARKAVAKEIQEKTKINGMSARQARLNKRRVMSDLDHTFSEWGLDMSDMSKFISLKHKSKRVKFGRSSIHNWGLFAQEPIAPDEMVIEYIGEKIRANIADLREKQYERVGIGSSYLFRVDDFSVIDATKTGNYARFMNHCCTPNSYAKVISVDGQKKIVIFSKQQINPGEEITYDYKFPIEENKIPCLCGSAGCRKSLN